MTRMSCMPASYQNLKKSRNQADFVIRHRQALLLEQRGFQTAALVTTADCADGLGSERDDLGDPRRAGAFGQFAAAPGRAGRPEPAAHRYPAVSRVPSGPLA